MLIIGHRGAAGLAPENTLEALDAGIKAGADILEFDIRLTKDGIPVLVHDFHTVRTERTASMISRSTLKQLRHRTRKNPILTLKDALDAYFGSIVLNIEVKTKSAARATTELIRDNYIKTSSDWDNVLISSYRYGALRTVRKLSSEASIGFLHRQNPFIFMAHTRSLKLSAVGFHRLHINPLALQIAKKSGLFTYAYTVDRPHAAYLLARQGLDAVVTNHPDRVLAHLKLPEE